MKDDGPRTSSGGGRGAAWIGCAVLAASLTVSAFAWRQSIDEAERDRTAQFEALATEVRLRLDERVAAYTQIVRGGAALFAAAGPIGRDGWRAYVSGLDLAGHFPAIPAVAFARMVTDAQREGFLAEIRGDGKPDFAIRPPGRRERYVVNVYTDPFTGANVRALGYDMWQDSDRRTTMERAVALGQPAITERITLRVDEDANPVPAFIMYMPVRLAPGGEIYGFVLSPFRMPTLMRDVMDRHANMLALSIYDGPEADPGRLFHREGPDGRILPGTIVSRQGLEIGGRTWTLEFTSLPGLDSGRDAHRPLITAATGLALSLLLASVAWSLARTRDRAEAIAAERTRSLKESQSLLGNIIDHSTAVIFVKSLDGRFILVNATYERLFHMAKEDVVGRTDFDIFPPAQASSFVENDRIVIDGGSAVTFEEVVTQDDGLHTYLSVKFVIPDADGVPAAICGISTDITELKQAANRISEINADLRRKAQQLERSNADLEQFAYVASHDLQEPLRMISSYAQLIARRYADRLDADAGDFIRYMVEGTTRMQAMIHDLLDYSRIGRKDDPPGQVDAEAVVEATRQQLKILLEEVGGRIEHGPLPTVTARPSQFLALMQNLIGNALKYRDPARAPVVSVTAERHGDEWRFAVRDNGIGIDPKYADKIFLIFQRLHTRDRYEGSGIGLAVCKKIVEHHGGRIWMESPAGGGSVFHFTLPAEEPADDPGQE